MWQINHFFNSAKENCFYTGLTGPVWIVDLVDKEPCKINTSLLCASNTSTAKNLVGSLVPSLLAQKLTCIGITFHKVEKNQIISSLVGLEIGHYSFKGRAQTPYYQIQNGTKAISNEIKQAASLCGVSTNISRHLVNLPGNKLNPKTYAEAAKTLFKGSKNTKVKVIDRNKLGELGYELLLTVGDSASAAPCIVHLRYRPQGAKGKPVAFVGKGITFDSGGINVKPHAGMRLMKKDMGGSAALMGLAYYLDHSNIKKPVDIYLCLAENAIDSKSARPGDVIKSKAGVEVEIHHTDAEGRLALASGLTMAQNAGKKDAPRAVIDVATLTGAIKIGLGSDVAGLFSNNDKLAAKIENASHSSGEHCWRMPMYQNYRSQIKSSFGDIVNSGGGYGGAITAALFLESFVENDIPWAHLDIYAWNDSPKGAVTEVGGSGQSVGLLIDLMKTI
ncbi:MAG: leucyl aminopeptidase family protein [Bacteriovoracaceae bacterium]|jgi:leucyl aminopeptidase|nr:leucyl aminopeptidase family protein [Bacteriovoracaceae bacterium]